jgi:hypothetical protein
VVGDDIDDRLRRLVGVDVEVDALNPVAYLDLRAMPVAWAREPQPIGGRVKSRTTVV